MTSPSPALIGVQRVVVDCAADSTLSNAERRAVCAQLVKKAARVTSLPVSVAAAADLDATNLARQSEQLLVRVAVSAKPAAQGRKLLTIAVTPVRPGRNVGKLGPLRSEGTLVNVQQDWIVQGPIDAFAKLLDSAPPVLHRPIQSDS